MTNIEVKGFQISYTGDPSVGIFPATWTIDGGFFFDTLEDLNQFKEKLKEAWEYCNDTPIGVETFEERNERLKKESELFPTPPDHQVK